MSFNIALNEIRHGSADGSIDIFEAGDDVSALPEDVIAALRAIGSVGTPVEVSKGVSDQLTSLQSEVASKDAEIATLKAAFAAANAANTAPTTTK